MRYVDSIKDIEENAVIYGTGMVAKLLYRYLIRRGWKKLIFTESVQNSNSFLLGAPVKSLDDIASDNQIIIATLSNYHDEIASVLIEKKRCNFYAVSEAFFQSMRNETIYEHNEIASLNLRVSELKRLADEKCRDVDFAIVSDNGLVKNIYSAVMSGGEFLADDSVYDGICILLIDWNEKWINVVTKAFRVSQKVYLSFRYKYLNYSNYHIIDIAKKNEFQLTSSSRFCRDEREYNSEDALFFFEKRSIQVLHKDALCTGCGLCEKKCMHDALCMRENEYGYKKPYIDFDKCIECNQCLRVCPVYDIDEKITHPDTYIFIGEDEIRRKSSSGGVFGTIAPFFLERDGVVCGAAWKNEIQVEHKVIFNTKEVSKLQLSKYVRSDIRPVMDEIKNHLIKGSSVLFTGCPCQVAAIKKYVKGYQDKLYTIDLICAEAPSSWILGKYINENFNLKEIKEISFREKVDGWRPDTFIIYKKNETRDIRHMEDIMQQAFHGRMLMDRACEHCNFAKTPRIGDITIGDAWGVSKHTDDIDSELGTSVVTVNSDKGEELLEILKLRSKKIERIPIEWVFTNRIINSIYPHIRRDQFYRDIKKYSFGKTFNQVRDKKHDVGLVGLWSYPNYGSQLTYYALYETIKKLGYSVLMIEWTEDSHIKPQGYASLFESSPYENDEIADHAMCHFEMTKYNSACDIFVLGSDQLLNPDLFHALGKMPNLDWVDADKKKIGVALSFGKKETNYDLYDRIDLSYCLKRFDAISVREKYAIDIFKDVFDIQPKLVLDPVFMCDKSKYIEIASRYIQADCNGIFAYILDMSGNIKHALEEISYGFGEELTLVTDAYENEANAISIEKWLGNIISSRCIITDSYHGTCFAIVFHKPFVAIRNNNRGGERFVSILEKLDCMDRLITSDQLSMIPVILNKQMNYIAIDSKLETAREDSLKWFQNALNLEHRETNNLRNSYFERKMRSFEETMWRCIEKYV